MGVAFISLCFALLPIGLQHAAPSSWLFKAALVAITFAAFLLRQRVTDEFKDKHHDAKYFPSRPFQRGTISSRALIVMWVIAFMIEISAVLLIAGAHSLVWYVPVVIYSLLMAKEFFVSRWLNKHFTTYFLLHEAIFLLFAVWLVNITNAPLNPPTLAWVLAFIGAMTSVEIGRKFEFRKDSKGSIVQDTYPAVWGRDKTLQALQVLIIATGITLSYANSTLVFATLSALAAPILSLKLSDILVKTTIIIHLSLLVIGLAIWNTA